MASDKADASRVYVFEVYGRRRENLGSAVLASDAEAIALARDMVEDLLQNSEKDYSGCSVLVTRDTRSVAVIPMIAPG